MLHPRRAAFAGPVLASLILAACSVPEDERGPPMVLLATAEPAGEGRITLAGDVRARVDSPLAFRVGGQIVERRVQLGQAVRRGQILARIDVADAQLATTEAEAQAEAAGRVVAAAEASARRAAADVARLEPLVGAGGIAPQALDAARAAAVASAAELAAARQRAAAAGAAAGRARNQLRYTSLVADADGTVAEVLADAGAFVAAGQPVLRLARAGPRDAVVAVPEGLRAALPRSADAQLIGDGRRFAATLREVSGAVDPLTRSFEARYALAGAEDVPPGQSVSLALGRDGPGRAVAVPIGALIDRGKGSAVWVLTADNRVRLRPVRVSAFQDDRAILAEGLAAGERVVALGAHLLSEGQAVQAGRLPQ